MQQLARPRPDELEICVFSRAGGEAIAVHVGEHRWVLIDSLLSEAKSPISLDYLDAIGVGAGAVDSILLTHWHDDHIKGAATMVRACAGARVAMPVVLKSGEFAGLLAATRPASEANEEFDTGVSELTEVLRELLGNPARHAWVLANAQFLLSQSPAYRFEALSPSSHDVTAFLAGLPASAAAIAKGGRLPSPDRNDTAVAAVVTVGKEHLLFGADLEAGTRLSGWEGVHGVFWMKRGRASFFKIPHHGSGNADYPQVHAALTPWNRNKGLPRPEDLRRIAGMTPNAYAAASAQSRSAARKDSVTSGILRDTGVGLVKVPTDLGYVRFRKQLGSPGGWQAECLGVGSYRIAA